MVDHEGATANTITDARSSYQPGLTTMSTFFGKNGPQSSASPLKLKKTPSQDLVSSRYRKSKNHPHLQVTEDGRHNLLA